VNLTFEYPWLFILFFLPWLVYRFTPAYLQPNVAIYVPFFTRFVQATGETLTAGSVAHKRRLIQLIALVLSWIGLVICLARPMVLGEAQVINKSGRDLMIAVDLSQSMERKDYTLLPAKRENGTVPEPEKVSRIDALKLLLVEFADNREGDRLGLTVFGTGAYLQVPFTQDLSLWQTLLNEMDTQMAGPATAIGDAIGLSIRAFSHSESNQRLLLLVTDGSDTSSRLDPLDAARVAATENITIYTLGMGDPTTEGDDKVDFKTLTNIAKISGGQSFVAADSESLKNILMEINDIAPANFEQLTYVPKTDLYPWVIGPLLLFYLLVWLSLTIYARVKSRGGVKHVS
jgi:Ca-activated chloride channel family protein